MVGARCSCAREELHRGDRRGRGGGSCCWGEGCVIGKFFENLWVVFVRLAAFVRGMVAWRL